MSASRLSRRELLARGAAGGLALALAGCGGLRVAAAARRCGAPGAAPAPSSRSPRRPCSTAPSWRRRRRSAQPLGTLAHLTDAHLLDAESPARVTFLARLGSPFTSTFRPQEALTAQVHGRRGPRRQRARARRRDPGRRPDRQRPGERAGARPGAARRRRRSIPTAARPATAACRCQANPDPFYYRPDIDAPRHPGMLAAATRRFRAAGLTAPLVPGARRPRPARPGGASRRAALTDRIARGDRAVWEPAERPARRRAGAERLAAVGAGRPARAGPARTADPPAALGPRGHRPRRPPPPPAGRRGGRRAPARRGRRPAARRRPARLRLRRRRAAAGDRPRPGPPRRRLGRHRSRRPARLARAAARPRRRGAG